MSTLPPTVTAVTVAETTTAGQPTLTLTETVPPVANGSKAKLAGSADGYTESLVINADTGLPVSWSGGISADRSASTISYGVTRVTLADVAAGKF